MDLYEPPDRHGRRPCYGATFTRGRLLPRTPPRLCRRWHLESAVLMADGETLHLLNVPAVSASGEFKCYDITCKFSAGADGTVRVNSISAAPTKMVPNLADQFIPGTYVDSFGVLYTLRGPAISGGGSRSFSDKASARKRIRKISRL